MIFRIPIIFFFFIAGILLPAGVCLASSIEKLQEQYQEANHDTLRVQILFEMGNQYLSGPSDSLIWFYSLALDLVNENLGKIAQEKAGPSTLYTSFRDLKIRALIELGIEYFFQSDYEKALESYFEALEIVKQTNNIELLSECLSEIGIVYKNQGKYDLALEYYDESLIYAEKTTDSSWLASCKINIGNVYKEKGYLTIALRYYFESLTTLEALGHDRRVAACYQNIGDIYRKQRDYIKALEYYSRALQLAISTDDKLRITNCYLNIGTVYSFMERFKPARNYYFKAYELYMELGYSHELDDCYILLGDSYLKEMNPDSAGYYYKLALDISTSEQDIARQAEILGKLGVIGLNRGQYTSALDFTKRALALAREIGSLDLSIRTTEILSEIYEKLGDESSALNQYKEYTRLKDSLFSVEKYKAITEMEVKYESDKKAQQLALLEERSQVQQLTLSRRNRLYLTSLLLLGSLLVLAYILYRNQRLKSRHRAIELEQKLMRSQMNPHFIFNSLIAIQSFIYKQEAVIAGDYLAKFADLIRITLENSRAEFVPLEKEVKMLNAYLELQALRFENKFIYSIEIDPEIGLDRFEIPPMLAQPFIENAIEHGLRHKTQKGSISVRLEKKEGYLRCTVVDDGVGRQKSGEMAKNKVHQSMATSITKERLAILSRREKKKFDLRITDLHDEKGGATGTQVVFEMPYREKEAF